MKDRELRILLRETAVQIERWSHHSMISCNLSDAMEEVASKLRRAELELVAPPKSGASDTKESV